MPQEGQQGFGALVNWFRSRFRRSEDEPQPPGAPTPLPPISTADREKMLQFARQAPAVYGFWRDLKWLYKHAEQTGDAELLGVLAGRMDAVPFPDPNMPRVSGGAVKDFKFVHSCYVTGSTLALLEGHYQGRKLHLYDIADPVSPAAGRLFNINAERVIPMGQYLIAGWRYSYPNNEVLKILDISGPGMPREMHSASLPGGVHGMNVFGSVLYVVEGGTYRSPAKLHLFDMAEPRSPRLLSTTTVPYISAVAAGPDFALLMPLSAYGQSDRLKVLNVSNPASPQVFDALRISNIMGGAVSGNYAFIVRGQVYQYSDRQPYGLEVIDLNHPGRSLARLDIGNALSVTVQGQYAYVGVMHSGTMKTNDYMRGGLRVVDISDPAKPRLAGSLDGGDVTRVEVNGSYAALLMGRAKVRLVDISDPAHPVFIGDSPSRDTLSYMKRRARRHLRQLAVRNPDQFTEVAAAALRQSGPGEIDPRTQWVSMDLLHGGCSRWGQHSHGRGAYFLKEKHLSLKTREELAPGSWDANIDRVRALWSEPNLPAGAYEFALKILRANRAEVPEPSGPVLSRFLASSSPLLAAAAARWVVEKMDAGQTIGSDLAADAYFRAGWILRRRMLALLEKQPRPWNTEFARRLFDLAEQQSQGRVFTRKELDTLGLLVERYGTMVAGRGQPAFIARLYVGGDASLSAWAVSLAGQAKPQDLLAWIAALEALEPEARGGLFEALLEGMKARQISREVAHSLVFGASTYLRETGWTLLQASQTVPEATTPLWEELLKSTELTPALQTAMSSPAALALLQRARLKSEFLIKRLQESPFLVQILPPAIFRIVVRTVPAATTLQLVAAAPEATWANLRDAALEGLREAGNLSAFWQAAWAAIPNDDTGNLKARLLDDPVMADSFLVVEDPAFLQSSNPIFGPLLSRWAEAHEALFTRDSAYLLGAATNSLPELRAWGLQRLSQVGMGLPFALRLLESEVPAAVAAGQAYFEAAVQGDRPLEPALALCDSPKKSVRSHGRDFVTRHWDRLPQAELLERLGENPDPLVQELVAARLSQPLPSSVATETFDREVLRTRNRGRRAKELVKKRLDHQPLQDIPALLELARSRTPQDAEWALQQLARLAVEGQVVEGLELVGPAGL